MNGLWRKVLVDDYLPCDNNDNVLVSKSSNANEFWVSLIEKAYMKVSICLLMFVCLFVWLCLVMFVCLFCLFLFCLYLFFMFVC